MYDEGGLTSLHGGEVELPLGLALWPGFTSDAVLAFASEEAVGAYRPLEEAEGNLV